MAWMEHNPSSSIIVIGLSINLIECAARFASDAVQREVLHWEWW
jgi:hypothetical protein